MPIAHPEHSIGNKANSSLLPVVRGGPFSAVFGQDWLRHQPRAESD